MHKRPGLFVISFMAIVVFACAGTSPTIVAPTSTTPLVFEPSITPSLANSVQVYDLPRNESDDPRKVGSFAYPDAKYEIGFPNNWNVTAVTRNSLREVYQKYKDQSPELANIVTSFAKIALAENNPEKQYALFAFDASPERLANGKTVILYITQYTEPKRIAVPLDKYISIFINDTSNQLDVMNTVKVFSDTKVPIAVVQAKFKQQNSSSKTVYISYFLVNTGKVYLEIVIQTNDPSFDVLKDLRLTLRSINFIELVKPSPTP